MARTTLTLGCLLALCAAALSAPLSKTTTVPASKIAHPSKGMGKGMGGGKRHLKMSDVPLGRIHDQLEQLHNETKAVSLFPTFTLLHHDVTL